MNEQNSRNPVRAGVIGWPIGHSLSPVIHRYWLSQFGIKGRYDPVPVPPEELQEAVHRLIQQEGWRGMNVTVPHKEAVLRLCDRIDATAERIGAVNTLVVAEDGSVEGRNTDLYGFRRNIETAPAWPQIGRTRAVVLGAGGASRAVIAALLELGFISVDVVNRTTLKADRLAQVFGASVSAHSFDDLPDLLAEADVLVNTTALGMKGQPRLTVDLSPLSPAALVTDIVYNPLKTELLAAAQARGNATVDGLGMLLHQAVPGFCAWFKPDMPPAVTTELREAVLQTLVQPT